MNLITEVRNGFLHFKGSLGVPRGFWDQNIPYKYVIYKGGSQEIEWESLPMKKNISNRCLTIPNGHERYAKYDDIIWKNQNQEQILKRHANGRFLAMSTFVPKRDDLLNNS